MSSIVVAGVVRDCGRYLEAVLNRLAGLEAYFETVHYVFVENDSRDNTKQILHKFGSQKSSVHLINLDGLLHIRERTQRIAICRNAYSVFIAECPEISDPAYVLVADMDDVNMSFSARELVEKAVPTLESVQKLVGVFPNQLPNYYDLWALRHHDLCPGDIFFDLAKRVFLTREFNEQIINSSLIGGLSPLTLPKTLEFVNVDSAFGGLGLYKYQQFQELNNTYCGLEIKFFRGADENLLPVSAEVCEHVAFHKSLRQQGYQLGVITGWVTNEQSHYRALPAAFATLYRQADGALLFTLDQKN